MAEEDLFQKLLRSLLLRDERQFDAAVNEAAQINMSAQQLERMMEKIQLWVRMKGLLPLRDEELSALVKLQSFFRFQYVRKKMTEKYILYCRLSTTDSEDYAHLANRYHRLLKL